jgi:hypothetical protein
MVETEPSLVQLEMLDSITSRQLITSLQVLSLNSLPSMEMKWHRSLMLLSLPNLQIQSGLYSLQVLMVSSLQGQKTSLSTE